MRTLIIRRSSAPIALAATLLMAFVLLFAWPQSAAAHDSLVGSDPVADSTIETLPEDLTLTFSAALIAGEGSTAVVVTDAEGNSISDGAPTVDGAMVIQPLVTDAAAGEYTVLWQVVSSDGHPTDGEFSFTLSGGTAGETPPSAEPTAAPGEVSAAPSASPSVTEEPNMASGFSISAPWLIAGAVVLLIVVFVIVMVVRSRRKSARRSGSDTPPGG